MLLTVFIEPNSEQITGWLETEDDPQRSFSGWLELTAMLRDAQAQAAEAVGGETLEPNRATESAS